MLKEIPLQALQNFPVNHLSPSAIRELLTNQMGFFKKYIRRQFDEKTGPSMLEGNLFHAVMESYYKRKKMKAEGMDVEKKFDHEVSLEFHTETAMQTGEFDKVDRGKTGSAENSIKTVQKCIEFYFQEIPKEIHTILDVEASSKVSIEDHEGERLPVALKGKIDLLWMDKKGNIFIEDHKTVTSFGDAEDPRLGKYFVPAYVYYFNVKHEYQIEPKAVIFREIKKSKNKDGSPQVRKYVYEITADGMKVFLALYERIVLFLAGIPLVDPAAGIFRFLPNPYDMMSDTGRLDFIAEILEDKTWSMDKITEMRSKMFVPVVTSDE